MQYTKSLELNPDFPLPLLGQAQLMLYRDRASGRTAEAVSVLDKLLAKYPSNVDALRLKASIVATKARTDTHFLTPFVYSQHPHAHAHAHAHTQPFRVHTTPISLIWS